MRKSLILAASIAVAALSSCTTTSNNAYTVTPETMIVNMTVADLDVSQDQVSATVSWNWNPFKTVGSREKAAEAEVLKASGADILVEPVFEVTHRGFLRGGSVTVTGHPAKLVNFRPMTMGDAAIIATLKNKVGVATPVITTTAPSFLDKLRPEATPKKPKVPKVKPLYSPVNSINVLYGFPSSDDIENPWSFSVMYARYKTWGWYAKLTVEGEESHVGVLATGGAVRRLPLNFSAYAGLGIGKTIPEGFAIPIEISAQWSWKRLNIMAGYQYAINCGGDAGVSRPFIGLGLNF